MRTIWMVTKPSSDSGLGDICWEQDLHELHLQYLGGLKQRDIVGFYDNEAEATEVAESLLKKNPGR